MNSVLLIKTMRLSVIYLVTLMSTFVLSNESVAQDFVTIDNERLLVCTQKIDVQSPPDFTASTCATRRTDVNLKDKVRWVPGVNPQNRLIWLRGYITLSEELKTQDAPLGLFISGKGARDVYLNEHYLGSDGKPGLTKADETIGPMDSVYYLPKEFLRDGENEIRLKMSAHYGFLNLAFLVQNIGIGSYGELSDRLLSTYWPSLVTLGVFAVGFFYFGIISILGRNIALSVTLALMSFFAGTQLIVNMLRALTTYSYPFHDLRVVLFICLPLGFGLSLVAHIIFRFAEKYQLWLIMGASLISVCVITFITDIDRKAVAAVLTPTFLCIVATLWWVKDKKAEAGRYALALIALAFVILSFFNLFFNSAFFFFVAAFILSLFVQQAQTLNWSEHSRRMQEERARRLELALSQVTEIQEPATIKIKSAGKLDIISVADISHCNGAGDYVQVCLINGQDILHGGTLNELEQELSADFLRVHRSHIVNTKQVKSLMRDNSGVGQLTMINGGIVPVSRRIMPRVKAVFYKEA